MSSPTNPWKVLKAKAIYDNPWLSVTENQVINPSGNPGIYGVIHFKNHAVAIIPVDAEQHTWLVGQYRFPVDSYEWEIPEGGAAAGESPLACAHRELKEETGLEAEHWQLILEMQLSNSVTDERSSTFLATGIRHGQAAPEETEQLHLRRVPLTEAIRMAASNEIKDALSVASLLKLESLLARGDIKLP